MSIIKERFTADYNEPFVVFIIGMRINKILSFSKWIPVAKAMRPMMEELAENKEHGLIGYEVLRAKRDSIIIQYWKSHEALMKYARGNRHMKAWREYYQKSHSSGAVGIWHETYCVEPTNYESIYANMPPFGLAKATKVIPVVGRYETANGRLNKETTFP